MDKRQFKIITIIENIKIYDAEIKKVFDSMPDAEVFNSLPGTGKCLVPRLLAAIGEDRNRFNNAQALQNYAGLSPVTERSGQKSGCTGVGIAPSLCDKALLNGQKKVLLIPIGRGNTMRNNELKANHINWR